MENKKQKAIELLFETILWKSRLITLLAVIFSMLSSLLLFIAGSTQIWQGSYDTFCRHSDHQDYNLLLTSIIGAVDLYLIGIVLLIFSFGIYELFISKIDPARYDKEVNILEITSLDDLKNRLIKVIIMALIVHFFKSILSTHFANPLEMLYLGIAILAVSAGTFFIRKIEKED